MIAAAGGTTVSRCRLCGGGPVRTVGVKRGELLYRCGACRIGFAHVAPDEEAHARLYGEPYFTAGGRGYADYLGDEHAHRRQARRYLRRIASVAPAGTRLLDIGCASGFFLDEARLAGWEVSGCDVSPWAAGIASRRFGLPVTVGAFPDVALPGAPFGVVTLFNVFEHLLDLRAAESRLREIVARDGVVLIETWDLDSLVARVLGTRWHQFQPAFVPWYLNRTALATLFDRRDWTLESWEPATKWISLERGIQVLMSASRASIDRLYASLPVARRLAHVELPYRLGDLTLAVLRRRR